MGPDGEPISPALSSGLVVYETPLLAQGISKVHSNTVRTLDNLDGSSRKAASKLETSRGGGEEKGGEVRTHR
jgi:hypothetical protein